MAKYYFVLQWADREHDDPHGTSLPDDRAARGYAERIVRELKEAGGYDEPDLAMVVKTGAGRIVCLIQFEEASRPPA
jgi:hypothetical protein